MQKLKELFHKLISKKNEKIILISGGVFIVLFIGVLVLSFVYQKPKETNSQPTQTVEEKEVIVEEISNIDLSHLPIDEDVRKPLEEAFSKLLQYDQITYTTYFCESEGCSSRYTSIDFKSKQSISYESWGSVGSGCEMNKYIINNENQSKLGFNKIAQKEENQGIDKDTFINELIEKFSDALNYITEDTEHKLVVDIIIENDLTTYQFKLPESVRKDWFMNRETTITIDDKQVIKQIIFPSIYSRGEIFDIVDSKVIDNFEQELSSKQINKNLVSQVTINKVQNAFNKLKNKGEFMITEKASSISEIGDKDYVMTKTIQNVPEKKSTVYGLSWEGVEDEYQRNGADYFDNLGLVEDYLMKFLTGTFDENMIKYLKVTETTSIVNVKGIDAIQIDLKYTYSINDHSFCVELNGGNVNTISITLSKSGDLISIKNMPNPYTEESFIYHGMGHREDVDIFFDYGEELLKPISAPVRTQ
jgi:hypothetical protein